MSDVYLGKSDRPPGLEQVASGKVRDIYRLDPDHLLFVTSDRISAFDVVMDQGLPGKGRILTSIAAYWLEETRDIVANHLVSTSIDEVQGLDTEWRERLRGRVMIVRETAPDPIEWVVRGYLAGSGWKEYQESSTVCSIPLPAGLQQASSSPTRSSLQRPSTKPRTARSLPPRPRRSSALIDGRMARTSA